MKLRFRISTMLLIVMNIVLMISCWKFYFEKERYQRKTEAMLEICDWIDFKAIQLKKARYVQKEKQVFSQGLGEVMEICVTYIRNAEVHGAVDNTTPTGNKIKVNQSWTEWFSSL